MAIEVLLTGSFGVGKSSIFNRFIYKEFSNKYYGTIGVRVNEQVLGLGGDSVTLRLWDVAGEVKQERVPHAYFKDKDMILYIIDLSRPFTFQFVSDDLTYLTANAKNTPVILIGNKVDLVTQKKREELMSKDFPIEFEWFTSAKTGECIEELFHAIAKQCHGFT